MEKKANAYLKLLNFRNLSIV